MHVALTYDGGTLTGYVDGQLAGQNTSVTGSFNLTDLSFQIGSDGKSPADSHEIDGIVDEVRASNTNRSADWIEASYLSQNGTFAFTSFGTEQVTTTDTVAPVVLSKGTVDLNSDGYIDAIHLTFSEVISDASVEVGDFTISAPGVTGLAFNPTAGGDTANDEDIYLSFDDGVHPTGITPTVAYAQSGATDLQNLSAAPNKVANFSANDNPLNSVPGAQVTNEDTALVFDTAGGNLISISDADAGGSPVKVTLNGTNGLITLSDTAGLSFSPGDGTADANMTFTGTIADINTALDGLTFDPTPEFSGAASLQIITDDQGNTGAGGPQADDDTIAITVSEVNDAPTVVLSNTVSSIGEDADTTLRTEVADITVTDDAPGTNVLSLSGADAGLFEIESGVLYLKAGTVLDYETNGQLDVTVQVNDTTLLPDPNDTAALSITVTDANETPTVALSNTTPSISEGADTTSRTRVADITVTDDALGTNVLSLSGADAGLFEIDSGVLYLEAGTDLDFETNGQLDVTVQINDTTLLPDPNDTAALSITVTDANEAPTVALSNTTVSISEAADTTNRTQVADITVTDDALGTAVLSLAGADAGLFEIDSGVLYLKAGEILDYETNAQLDVTVQVNDDSLLPDPNDTAALNITITDVNEAPTVMLSNTTTSISEAADTTNRTQVADITITDDALGTEVLSLSGTDAGLFEIDSGVLYLKAGATLDFEINAQLDVTVQVNDATLAPDPNDTAALSITVTDANEAPTVTLSNTTSSISEGADTTNRTRVADITVTDDALGTEDLSLSGADAGRFEIDSGILYLKAGATLDFEANPQLDVTVQVNDATLAPDPNDTAALNITVTDANDPPTLTLSNTMVSISEGADTTSRTEAADITVTDDALGTNVLSLSGADAGLFEIDSGVLYLKAGVVLDQATNPQLDVTVQVNDATLLPDPNHTADLSITVNVVTGTNNPPTVTLSNTTTSLSEAADTATRTRVADITVTDDALGTNVLSLSGADAGLFEIASEVLYLKAGANLDHETNGQLDVTVQVNDAGLLPNPNHTAALSITVSDTNEAPFVTLSNTTISISEVADTTNRTQVADITVTDDALGTHALSLSGADAGLFEIDAGVLYLKAGATLDYQANAQLDVTVQVNDATLFPNPNDTAALSISVTEANNPPTINALAGYDVDEDSAYNLLAGISIADVDAGSADVRVTLEVANGVLRIGDTSGLTTISGNSSASVVLKGSVADLNGALASLSYRPDPDFSGSDDPLVTVNDLGNTGPGGPQDASTRVSLVVNPVNDPGTVTIDNLTPAQGDRLTASVADVEGAGGSIAYQWYRDGMPIEGATAADHTTTQADVNKVITVTADHTDDLAGVESPTSAGTTPVTNVNDAPILGNNRLSISQGATVTLDSSMLSAADVDHPAAALVFSVSGVTAGHFALAGDPSTPITSFEQSEISAGSVVFVHDGSQVQPGYSVSVSDGFAGTTASPAGIEFILRIPSDAFLTLADELAPPKAANEVKPDPPADGPLSDGSDGRITVSGDALISISGSDQDDVADGAVVFIQAGNRAATAAGTAPGPEESARNADMASRPASFFSYHKLKLLLNAQNSGELQTAVRKLHISTLSPSDYALVRNSLDAIRQEISHEIQLGKTVLGSAIATSIGLSAGYVVWLLKGGSLLASVLSSLPAWQLTDPMAILAGNDGIGPNDEDGDDDESLETIIDKGTKVDEDDKKQTSELKNDKTSR